MTHDDISRAAEQAAILAAFPTRSGRHDLCAEASHDELSAEFEAFDAGVRGRMDARRSHDDLKAEALQAEVVALKSLCREAADSLAGAIECIREDVAGGVDEDDERGQVDLIRRLREAGGREA